MNWKEFLKPNWKKIMIMIILLLISSIRIPKVCLFIGTSCPESYGLPLVFYEIGYLDNVTNSPINFIIDLIFWYIVSCIVVTIYDKFKKKK